MSPRKDNYDVNAIWDGTHLTFAISVDDDTVIIGEIPLSTDLSQDVPNKVEGEVRVYDIDKQDSITQLFLAFAVR